MSINSHTKPNPLSAALTPLRHLADASLSHVSFLPGSDPTAQYLLLLGLGTGFSQLLAAVFVKPTILAPSRTGYRTLDTADLDADDPYASPLPSRSSSPSPRTSSPLPSAARPRPSASPHLEHGNPFDAPHAHSSPGRPSPLGRSASKEREEGARGAVDVTGWALVRERDFWTMWLELGLCSGIGLMFINNCGTVVRTLAPVGMDPAVVRQTQTKLVSLLSLSSCAGRLAAGFSVSRELRPALLGIVADSSASPHAQGDWLAHHAPLHMRISRVWLLVPMALGFIVSQLLARSAESIEGWGGLTPPTILTGLCYGWLFAVSPVLCLDRFGINS